MALISDFETQLLLQADREPFFYGSLTMMSQEDIQRLVDQLDEGKPAKVFIDKRILSITGNTTLNTLIDNLKAHYQYAGKQSDIWSFCKGTMNNLNNKQLKDWGFLSLTALLLSIQALLLMMKAVNFFQALPQVIILGLWLVLFIAGQIIAALLFNYRHKEKGWGQGL